METVQLATFGENEAALPALCCSFGRFGDACSEVALGNPKGKVPHYHQRRRAETASAARGNGQAAIKSAS